MGSPAGPHSSIMYHPITGSPKEVHVPWFTERFAKLHAAVVCIRVRISEGKFCRIRSTCTYSVSGGLGRARIIGVGRDGNGGGG